MISIAILSFGVDFPFEKGIFIDGTIENSEYRFIYFDLEEYTNPVHFESMIKQVSDCNLTIIEVKDIPETYDRFDRLISKLIDDTDILLHSANRASNDAHRNLFSGSDEYYVQLMRYLNFGLDINMPGIATLISNNVSGTNIPLPRPNRHRYDGLYVPTYGDAICPKDEENPCRPCVGLMFSSLLWSGEDTAHIDAVIHEFESRNVSVIPVFYTAIAFASEGVPTPEDVVKRYFTDDNEPIVDAIVVSSPFSMTSVSGNTGRNENFISKLVDVPIFHIMTSRDRYLNYSRCLNAGKVTDIRTQTVLPEMDGQIITYPVAEHMENESSSKLSPVHGRIIALVELVCNWINLSKKENCNKKIAILVYQNRPDKGHIANAAGLDTPASLIRLVERLISEGYSIDSFPEDPATLVDMMVENIGNDADDRSENELRALDPRTMNNSEYRRTFDEIPDFDHDMMKEQWGEPPGNIMLLDDSILIPGMAFGNLFLGYQPMRSSPNSNVDIHDTSVSTTHQYLAYYRWIRDVFKADAILHFGTHGSLEWLPGKSLGLSEECFPEMILSNIPNICPYIVNDPGEGIQAKRRTGAVLISHLPPSMVKSGNHGGMERLDNLISELRMKEHSPGYITGPMLSEIRKELSDTGIGASLGIDPGCTDKMLLSSIATIHDYLDDLAGTLIKYGFHILGNHPEDSELDEFISSCLPMEFRVDKELCDIIYSLLPSFRQCGYDFDECMNILSTSDKEHVSEEMLRHLLETIHALINTNQEIDSIIDALNGKYVMPSPSGSVTKGDSNIFPTGRNFYGIDPHSVPSWTSYENGKRMASDLISRYTSDKGTYPKSVTVVLWATDVVKNGGEDVSMVLALMGLIPIWDSSGIVTGLYAIPLEELGRPRIDVTIRITGLFRDMFGNIIDLLDDGVNIVASLNESTNDNKLRSNIQENILSSMKEGIPEDEARKHSSLRIFGPDIGNYGFGMDLDSPGGFTRMADEYIGYGCFGYSKGSPPIGSRASFIRRIVSSDMLVKNMTDREIDALDTDDVFGFLGGLMAVQRSEGKKPDAFIIDSSVQDRLRIRTIGQELGFIFQSKICNPKYIEGLKRHGYRGAMEISKMTDNLIGWGITGDAVEDWMYEEVVSSYLDDEETRQWMIDSNPYAITHIIEQLFRAVSEGLWTCDEDILNRLRGYYQDAEAAIESCQE